MTAITIKNHSGREVNPHPYNPYSQQWIEFEAKCVDYPCPELSDTKPGETVEAELVDAVEKDNGKIEICDVKPLYGIRELGWKEIKVWKVLSSNTSSQQVNVGQLSEGESKALTIEQIVEETLAQVAFNFVERIYELEGDSYILNMKTEIVEKIKSLTPYIGNK